MTTENDEVHGTVIHSGYDSEPEANPTMESSDRAPGPDDAAGLTEDDERYVTAASSRPDDSGTPAASSAEDNDPLGGSTAEDSNTPGESTAEDSDIPRDSTVEDRDTLGDSTAEDNDTAATSPAQDGDVPALGLESAEEERGDYEDSADEDEDQIIVADPQGTADEDEPLDSADAEGGEAADLEALDEEQVAPDALHGQAANSEAAIPAQPASVTDAVPPRPASAADGMTSAQEAHAPAHSRVPSDTEFADDTGLAGDPEEMRRRWAAIQSSFVDDPRESVTVAATFLSEVMTTLLANARERENELRTESERDDLDTEDLRTILRRYRGFIDRLAAL